MEKPMRSPALDIVRSFALLCVISVHFFYNSGFYNQPVTGWEMYLAVILRSFFLICVPLFLMLSGYLLGSKRPNSAYFSKVWKTLGIYVLSCAACNLYRMAKGTYISPVGFVASILDFSAAPYAWYIEMYLGLFFLIPFLNVLYDGLSDRKQKRLLLLVLLGLTALPPILNVHKIAGPAWWQNPGADSAYHQLFPQWWTGVYPITYYMLGRYLREFPRNWKADQCLLLILASALLHGFFNIYRSQNIPLVLGAWQDYGALPVVIQAVLVFVFLAERSYDRFPAWLNRLFAKLSAWSLGAYLVSWIFDQIFYPLFCAPLGGQALPLGYMLLLVPCVFLCATTLSGLLNGIYSLLSGLISRLWRSKTKV